MATLTHDYELRRRRNGSQADLVALVPLTLNDDGTVTDGEQLEGTINQTTGALSITAPDGHYRVSHARCVQAEVPTPWNAAVYVIVSGSADLLELTAYRTVEALRLAVERASADSRYARFSGPLGGWHAALASDPATATLVMLGDSTSYEPSAGDLYSELRSFQTQPGKPLEGVASANIVAGGNNGASLRAWLDNSGGLTYTPADLIADAPDLIVASWGLNDVRLGTVDAATMRARMVEFIEWVGANVPDADVLLRIPAALTTTVVGTDFVDGITHQAATDLLRDVYLSLVGVYRNVDVLNHQADTFGTTAWASSPLMTDELHPNGNGQRLVARAVAARIGHSTANGPSGLAPRYYGYRVEARVVGAGNGYIDLTNAYADNRYGPATQWPVTNGDVLWIGGFGRVAISGATFFQISTLLRISMAGTDFTGLIGTLVTLDMNHPGPGAQEGRHSATLDPGSIAAGATLDVTTTITGITREMGVVMTPPSAITSTGLLWSATISADNTVLIRLHNPTGSPIDLASNNGWRFWILR